MGRRERADFLHFALETRVVIDKLIDLLDKERTPFEFQSLELKWELLEALHKLTAVESRALRMYRAGN